MNVLTEIIGKMDFTRQDTRIDAVLALHTRKLGNNDHIDIQTFSFALEFPPPQQKHYENIFPLNKTKLNQLQVQLHCDNYSEMAGKKVRVYYLNSQIIDVEPLADVR